MLHDKLLLQLLQIWHSLISGDFEILDKRISIWKRQIRKFVSVSPVFQGGISLTIVQIWFATSVQYFAAYLLSYSEKN